MEISFNKMTSMNFLSCTKSQGLFSSLPKSVQRALPWESEPFTPGLWAPWMCSASPDSQGSPKGTAGLPPSSSSLPLFPLPLHFRPPFLKVFIMTLHPFHLFPMEPATLPLWLPVPSDTRTNHLLSPQGFLTVF